MSEPNGTSKTTVVHETREVPSGLLGTLLDLGRQVLGVVPPAFLILCAINVVFLYVVMGFMDSQTQMRFELFKQLMDKCVLGAK